MLDFRSAWDTVGNGCEVVETFSLSYASLRAAMEAVTDFLGMAACENSNVVADDAQKLTVLLGGVFLGGMQVLAIKHYRYSLSPSLYRVAGELGSLHVE